MIECTNCETAQFLQITRSKIYFVDSDLINEINETFECTLCGATGQYIATKQGESVDISGDLRLTKERPKFA